MKILSIETSCDETAVSILDITGPLDKPEIKVLGNTLLSQMHLHAEFGGVYPDLAKREHQKNLPPLLEEALKEAGMDTVNPPLDCIAVTVGPGLEPALWVGIEFAETLGKKWNKPVVPVNHMEGHIYSVLTSLSSGSLKLPALALLISGGHTELVHIKDFGEYQILGRTLDDAVGEAYDKVARMLGLSYPGGPLVAALADKARERGLVPSFTLPRPMINSGDFNFSFSGLKTAVLYKVKAEKRDDEGFREEMALAFEEAVAEVLTEKTRRALESLGDIMSLIVAGGVSANKYLIDRFRELTEEFSGLYLHAPEKSLTTDNALMIGIAAYVKIRTNPTILKDKPKLIAQGNLSIS